MTSPGQQRQLVLNPRLKSRVWHAGVCVCACRKFSLWHFTLDCGIRTESPWLCIFEGINLLHLKEVVGEWLGSFWDVLFLQGQELTQAQVCVSYNPEGAWWFLTSVPNSSLAGQSDHSFPQALQDSSGHRRGKKIKQQNPEKSCFQLIQCRWLTPTSTVPPTPYQSDVICLWSTLKISFSLLYWSFFLSW